LFFNNYQKEKVLSNISHILVEKDQRKMTVYYGDNSFKEYKIALGSQPKGPKRQQGDSKTPEGLYKIMHKNKASKFHLSLKVSYPNENDVKQAISRNVDPGNDIMIHGLGKGLGWIGAMHVMRDWTQGCIAVTNPEIEEIFAATSIGIPVEIRP
jgi:murein L,D-transpeptidase YafK